MTLREFRHVRSSIQPHIRTTPIVSSELSHLYLKLENLQYTHSFKIRGAFAHILQLVEKGNKHTVLTVSAGNHGQAIARAASVFKIPCMVVVPANAPRNKIEAIRSYGAELRLEGADAIDELSRSPGRLHCCCAMRQCYTAPFLSCVASDDRRAG